MRFAKWVFLGAGIYGFIVLTPLYFLEGAINRTSAPVTHPEYFYGFIGAALVFQVLFLLIGRDPIRFRPAMLVGVLEKLSWGVPVWVLAAQGRVAGPVIVFASIDRALGALFVAAYVKTRSSPRAKPD
jgi:hypothetical protein